KNYPTLKPRTVWKLRAGHHDVGRGFEQLPPAVDELHGAAFGVVLVPLQIQNAGPKIHGFFELLCEIYIRCSQPDAEAHGTMLKQLTMSLTWRVFGGPIRGLRRHDPAEGEETKC